VGRRQLARALRGGRAKALSRGGLLALPEYGRLEDYDEDSIVAAIDRLLAEGRLVRTGRRQAMVWIPGKPVRRKLHAPGGGDGSTGEGAPENERKNRSWQRSGGDIARALDNYRKRRARSLKWKTHRVFQRAAILAIDREEPTSLEALARIPGLGPAKIERFGQDILDLVRRHRRRPPD
jgi:ATP-dependent DNA helicase RecQ